MGDNILKRIRHKLPMVLVFVCFSSLFTGCSDMSGPSDSQVKADFLARQPCGKDSAVGRGKIVVDDLKVVGKSVQSNEATVLVDIRYHGTGAPGLLNLWPCGSFNSGIDKGVVQAQMFYRKYDTGWRLEAQQTKSIQ